MTAHCASFAVSFLPSFIYWPPMSSQIKGDLLKQIPREVRFRSARFMAFIHKLLCLFEQKCMIGSMDRFSYGNESLSATNPVLCSAWP